MPTYEYRCQDCQQKYEARLSMHDKENGTRPSCPQCGSSRGEQVFHSLMFSKARPESKGCFGPSCERYDKARDGVACACPAQGCSH